MGDDCIAEEFARAIQDVSLREVLQLDRDLFHATKAIGDIEATKAILSLADVRGRNGAAEAGFGQAGAARADEYVSLTASKDRGVAYFNILVAIAAIAEEKATPDQWLRWYLARWGDRAEMLKAVATDFESELSCALALSLEKLDFPTVRQPPTHIWENAVSALSSRRPVDRLAWLFELDGALMQVEGADQDRGLGVVRAKAEAWSKVRLCDVALLRVRLSAEAVGYLHPDEVEVRVRGVVDRFEVVARGTDRFATWTW